MGAVDLGVEMLELNGKLIEFGHYRRLQHGKPVRWFVVYRLPYKRKWHIAAEGKDRSSVYALAFRRLLATTADLALNPATDPVAPSREIVHEVST